MEQSIISNTCAYPAISTQNGSTEITVQFHLGEIKVSSYLFDQIFPSNNDWSIHFFSAICISFIIPCNRGVHLYRFMVFESTAALMSEIPISRIGISPLYIKDCPPFSEPILWTVTVQSWFNNPISILVNLWGRAWGSSRILILIPWLKVIIFIITVWPLEVFYKSRVLKESDREALRNRRG